MDGALLSKGPAPKEAFDGKVVWITGASQVRTTAGRCREQLGLPLIKVTTGRIRHQPAGATPSTAGPGR